MDIDILHFGEEIIEGAYLEVPYRGVLRVFNLLGIADLTRDVFVLGSGAVRGLLAGADLSGVRDFGRACSMLMAVDIGNTQTVLGFFEDEELRGRWRITTEAYRTADELGAVSDGLLRLRGLGLDRVEALIVSSVVPGLNRSYKNMAEQILEVPFYQVTAMMQTGLKNRYDDPEAVGADRIVNAVAAGRYYGYPTIIVDFGTATTVCTVDAEGAYRGGAILPGLYVALDALVAQTAKLPGVDLEEEPPKAIATNTPDSIRSGFIYGYAGAVDALIRRMSEELAIGSTNTPDNASAEDSYEAPEGLCVLATGGPAPAIVRHCREIDTIDADLTLKGLRILYELNA